MDEKFEQCSEKNSTEKVSDLSVSNQETPEDYKNKVAQNTEARKLGSSEARKLGQTPSSLDLPKISLDEFFALTSHQKETLNKSKVQTKTCAVSRRISRSRIILVVAKVSKSLVTMFMQTRRQYLQRQMTKDVW